MKRLLINGLLAGVFFAGLASCQTMKQSGRTQHSGLTQEQQYKEADLFAKAVTLKETGRFQAADSLMKQVLKINPDDPAANFEEGKLQTVLGNTKEALVYAGKAVELDSTNIWYRVTFANLSKANGKYQDYVNTYKFLVKQRPNSERFAQELANAYNYVGNYKSAVQAYVNLQSLIGMNELLSQKIASLYVRLGEKDKALLEYEKLIKANPDDQRSYELLAQFASQNGFLKKAEWAYHKIIEISPNDPYVHISLADFYKKQGKDELSFEELKKGFANPKLDVNTEINLLAAYYSGNLTPEQSKQALELSEIIKKVHPDEPLSKAFYASMLFQNKKYKEALPLLIAATKATPDNYALWEQTLFTYMNLQEYKRLKTWSVEAINKFPDHPVPYLMAGIATFQMKEYKSTLNYLNQGKDLVSGNSALLEQFYSTLGDTYHELKMMKKSYASYDQALELNPDNSYVLNNYAYYLAEDKQNLDKAATMAAKAVKMDPYNENNLDTYAWVLYRQKKYDQALEWEKKAVANGGDTSGVVLEHYGDILYQQGKHKEALVWWKKAKKYKDYSKFLDRKIKTGKLYE
ncbi:MAG: tetratricopeptide repeat protein [Bacteroidales bacterium]|nr:tetratricopeptide repeat protein [Bacteroidales bacterium]